MQFQFLRSQGAKTLDELFELDMPDVTRAGDNIGNEIGSMLRPNKQVKESPIQMLGDVITNPGKLNDPFASDFEIFNNSSNDILGV